MKNEYQNIELKNWTNKFKEILKWQFNRPDYHPTYKSAKGKLEVIEPNWDLIKNPKTDLQVTWIGQSTLLVQIEGVNILTDPIFSERCAPVQFAGPRRITRLPMTIAELPEIHAVVISHNHYDHLDLNSVKELGNVPRWFVPLGLGKWFKKRDITNIVELDWWEKFEFGSIKFICTPSQHFSSRTPFDRNETLWCSWAVLGMEQRFWFGGDTGYFSKFRAIGDKYGPFDLAAIPIGAYDPEWFMQPIHLTPEQAVQVHIDLQANNSIAIHWGTFILTDEPIEEPPQRLGNELMKREIPLEKFTVLKHGETHIPK